VSGRLILRNRIRGRRVHLPLLNQIVEALLRDLLHHQIDELGIYIVGRVQITLLNETFLRHKGPTDVIAFDYRESPRDKPIAGEIFVCLDEAITQARRFRATWQQELVRYIVHGTLHLCGYDDRRKTMRLKMKRRENQLLKALTTRFPLKELART
jgi:probable rRNA maturation factor